MIRALNAIALLAACVLAVALYRAKSEAQDARERVENLQVEVAEERRAAAVLRAEIAYLERPERLRALSRKYLGLETLDPSREMDLEQVLLKLEELKEESEDGKTPDPDLRGDIVMTGGRDAAAAQ